MPEASPNPAAIPNPGGETVAGCVRLWQWTAVLAVLLAPMLAGVAAGSTLDNLLGLRSLTWSDANGSLGWEHPLPAWAWALVGLAAGGLAAWSYGRLLGPRPVRITLAGVRSLLLIAVVVLLAGPTLVDPREHEEPDALVLLVDRSGSLQVRDMRDEAGQAISRDEALRRAILSQADVFGDGALAGESRRTIWLGFGEQVYELPPLTTPEIWERDEVGAHAPGTAIRTALEQAVRAAGGRPLSSIVLFSDGRSPQSTGMDLVRQLNSRGAVVHVVPLGAETPPMDLAIGQVDAPREAFARDAIPVTVAVDLSGAPGVDLGRVRVLLVDEATGEPLDEQTLVEAEGDRVRLTARSEQEGLVRYRVEVVYDGPEPELITDNNARTVDVQIIDRPIRVLYVEGYPRWEYRYLKNALIREESIDSSMLLLSADRAFAQEGDSPITRPPNTAEEMARYDVVILGDVPPGYFTPQQLTLLRDHVVNGGGLMWIGGAYQTPMAWDGTPLEDVLPMRSPGSVTSVSHAGVGVQVQPAPLARRLNVLQLHGPRGEVLAGDWPGDLPPLRWVQELGSLKPTAEALAWDVSRGGEAGDAAPVLLRLRYGGGQALYLATDETWRWRYGRGELYHEQFWVQLVRMLGRSRVLETIDRARLTVSHRRVNVDEPVVVEVVVDDPALAERDLPQVAVTVRADGGRPRNGGEPGGLSGGVAIDQLQLRPAGPDGGTAGEAVSPTRRVYRALWRPNQSGELTLRAVEPALDDLGLMQTIEVVAADDEMRNVLPDHARLEALAEATGGQVIPLDELDRLVPLVPNLAEKVATDVREPLWHSPLAFGVVLFLLAFEWVLRKMIWLV